MGNDTLPIPTPVGHYKKMALHWWVDLYDYDGRYTETVCLQWAPNARMWCHSGDLGTGIFFGDHRLKGAVINQQAEMPLPIEEYRQI